MGRGGEDRPDEGTLAIARRRFVESLDRKASELKAGLALLVATPDADRPRQELRRRLHALLASAQVFHSEALADALREAVARLDAARIARRALFQEDLDALANLCATLPALGAKADSLSVWPPSLPSSPAPAPGHSSIPSRPPFEPSPSAAFAHVRLPALPEVAPIAPAPSRERSITLKMGAVTPPGDSAPPVDPGAQRRPRSGTFTAATGSRPPSSPPPASVRPAPAVISVLVVDKVETQAAVRALLAVDAFEVAGASDPEEALRLARSTAPDVVVVDRALVLRPGVDLIGRLRSDPLTDFVPVLLLLPPGAPHDPVAVRESGANDAVPRPLAAEPLRRAVTRAVGAAQIGHSLPEVVPDGSVADIADRVAEEVRRGLAGSLEQGQDTQIPVSGGAELLAATWAAVARIRTYLTRRSAGRVTFRDPPGRGPALLALVASGDEVAETGGSEVALEGRTALVVDDDISIVWFFAGLLRGAGMEVMEAFDGREALAAARRRRPELVVSDILMPGLDGFALIREMRRDLWLADVPVILLSWKEDFLQRMRELGADADGYLRKEVGGSEALARVQQALRPRARLEMALRTENEVRGRLERVGFPTLVETTARSWPDARITVRDAASLYELDLREGVPVDVTRTAIDGTFARGESALRALVGLRSGRFTVQRAAGAVRPTLNGHRALREAAERVSACIDAVSGAALVRAARVKLDDGAMDAIERTSPEPMRSVLERLRDGESPRDLVTGGEIAPQVLETCLVDLARHGALAGVWGPDGEDRIEHSYLERLAALEPRPTTRSSLPPPRADSSPPEPIRLSDPDLRVQLIVDTTQAEEPRPAARRPSTVPPPFPARQSVDLSAVVGVPVGEPAAGTQVEDPEPVIELTEAQRIERISEHEIHTLPEWHARPAGQRKSLEVVEDPALIAAVAALVSPREDEAVDYGAPAEAEPEEPEVATDWPEEGPQPEPDGQAPVVPAPVISAPVQMVRGAPESVPEIPAAPERRRSSRPPLDEARMEEASLPSVIVERELEPLVTRVDPDAISVDLAQDEARAGSGIAFVVAMVLVGLLAIGALAWSMMRGSQDGPPTEPPAATAPS